jgi:amidohydrolase
MFRSNKSKTPYFSYLIENMYPSVVAMRRHIHKNPELSGKEQKTAMFVVKQLSAIGLQPTLHVNDTGVRAEIENGKGATVVLRADTDALPVQENTKASYSSQNPGVMHACGHDMHTAILLGAANILYRIRSEWSGKVVLLFQPSEEVEPGGAIRLIQEKAFPEKASAVFGLHVDASHPAGSIGLRAGPDYAGVLAFDVTVKGKGGHGAVPNDSVDPIVCASSMILELQTLISRERPAFEPAVLTVGSIHAGSLRNIIPDEATFYGTIRSHTPTALDLLKKRVGEMLQSIAKSYRAEVITRFERSYPPSYNNPGVTDRCHTAFVELFGAENVIVRSNPVMAAEDFAYYLERVPGLYIHLGVCPRNKKQLHAIHSAGFLPDENAMKTGMGAHVAFVLEFLGKQNELV